MPCPAFCYVYLPATISLYKASGISSAWLVIGFFGTNEKAAVAKFQNLRRAAHQIKERLYIDPFKHSNTTTTNVNT